MEDAGDIGNLPPSFTHVCTTPPAKFLALFFSPPVARLCGMDTSNDLALVYSGWPAQDVTWIPRVGVGGTKRGISNEPGAVLFDGAVQLDVPSLQYPTASFPGVRQGDRFIFDRHTWIASAGPTRSQDGGESVVPIARAGA